MYRYHWETNPWASVVFPDSYFNLMMGIGKYEALTPGVRFDVYSVVNPLVSVHIGDYTLSLMYGLFTDQESGDIKRLFFGLAKKF